MDEHKPTRSEKIILDNWDWITEQRKAGMSWDMIEMELGVGHVTMLRYKDPERYWKEKERNRLKAEKARRELGVDAGRPRIYRKLHDPVTGKIQVLGELPPQRDTRDLTARMFGDPLPGRSALDRMKQESRR